MTRNEKYPDTKWFVNYNANPKGKITADCVVRAISNALDEKWETTYRELAEFGIKNCLMLNDKKCYEKYLEKKGFEKKAEPRKSWDNRKMTVVECIKCGIIKKDDVIVAHVGSHHTTCIKNAKVMDSWDCSEDTMHNYWVKHNN